MYELLVYAVPTTSSFQCVPHFTEVILKYSRNG